MKKEVCDVLNRRVDVYQRRGAGGTYPYLKSGDVIRRANEAFGHSWSSEVISVSETNGYILTHVRVSVWDTEINQWVHHEGFGGASIALNSQTKAIVDLGNDYKSSYTKALKKALEQFGIGLGDEEDGEDEVNHAAPATNKPTGNTFVPKVNNPVPKTVSQSAPSPQPKAVVAPKAAAPVAKPSPLPSSVSSLGAGTGKASSMQIGAIRSLAKMHNVATSDTELLSRALPSANKTKLDDLSNIEAQAVIKFINENSNTNTTQE